MNKKSKELIKDLKTCLIDSQIPIVLNCNDYTFLIEPCTKLQIWRNNKVIAEFETLDDLLNHFEVNGKSLISQISKTYIEEIY